MKKHSRNKSLDSALTRQRFSIRKLSIGAVSVLLGTVFYLGNNVQNQAVHAATKDETSVISNTKDDSSSEQQDTVDQGKQAVQNSTDTFTPRKVRNNVKL